MAEDIEKRLRYFTNQFLEEQDFTDEQAYHLDRQRRHNRLLHTPGIADGLTVTAAVGATQAEVAPGTAVDGEGRQIVLKNKQSVNFPGSNQTVLVVISYNQVETDQKLGGATRWHELPNVQAFPEGSAPPPTSHLRLARIAIDAAGKVASMSQDVRIQAGFRGDVADNSIGEKKLDAATRDKLNRALPTTGGTVNGLLNVRNRLDVQTSAAGTTGAALVWNGAGEGSFGLVARMTPTFTSGLPTPPRNAAVAGIADVANVHGVYATAKDETPALYVQGSALVTGQRTTPPAIGTHALYVDGTAFFTGQITSGGAKGGYVVDTFINASEQILKTGDIVKLKGSPVTRFYGQNNKIPVAEVTLADKENDTMTIGIVDSEALPLPNAPDNRTEPDDPTSIAPGGELYVVTLGAYAHCKVDATQAPIEVGDLLTSSANPGHAKKATNPQIGSIIGKALEPLKEGTGYIAVFVNIQ